MLNVLRVRSFSLIVLLLGALALVATACASGTKTGSPTGSATSGSSTSGGKVSGGASAPAPTTPKTTAPPAKPVNITGFPDGTTVGVGMPIIVQFNHKIKSGKTLQQNTVVTVNGKKVTGNWYFETSAAAKGGIEAHYRTQNYWPAHAHVHVAFNLKGKSAGGGYAYDGKLTSLDFRTGARNIVTVNAATHQLTVTSDGKPWGGSFPVSLGAPSTRTKNGTKVIMERLKTVCMHDTAGTYYECGIKWDQRLTYDGEYLHAAPWNVRNIQAGVDSSNGCTNLLPNDAIKLYNFLNVGDVVNYPNANGPKMQMGQGYGDWNVPWGQWQTGGLFSVS